MRASSNASTVNASLALRSPDDICNSRASSATANNVSMGNTGTSAPKANPCATAHAVRNPVKEPGPRPKTMAVNEASGISASANKASTAGINPLDA